MLPTAVRRGGAGGTRRRVLEHSRRRDGRWQSVQRSSRGHPAASGSRSPGSSARRAIGDHDGRAAPREARGRRRRTRATTASTCRPSRRTSPRRSEIKKVVDDPPRALRPPGRARQQRRRRRRRAGRRDPDQAPGHAARHQPALDLPLLPRMHADAARRPRAEHKNALVVNTSSISGKHGEALAVGLLRDQARRRRLDRSDEQGTRRRRHQVHRAVPGLRRHADDRLRQGAGAPPRR